MRRWLSESWVHGLIGALTLVATVVGVAWAVSHTASDPAPNAVTPTPTSALTPSTATRLPTELPQTGCVNNANAPVDCAASEAWLRVPVNPCAPQGASRRFGIDPDVKTLLIETRQSSESEHDSNCLVRPLAGTSSTAADLALTPPWSEELLTRLSACRQFREGDDVPCSTPHTIEYVGPWRTGHATPTQSLCEEPARTYVGERLDSPDSDLTISMFVEQGTTNYRCLVESRAPTQVSVWHRAGARK